MNQPFRPIAVCLCVLLAAGAAHAQSPGERSVPVDVTRLVGNGAVPGIKPMRTMRDLRYRDLLQQRYDFSCGSAALASLLHYGYGLDVSEAEMIKKMMVGVDPKEVVRNGFSMLDMKRYVSSIGMRAHGFRIEPDALYRLQMPVIALLDLKGYRHFVVVKGAAGGRVFVADPALGHRVMSEADFVRGWNGIVLAVVGDRPMRADSYLVKHRSSPALERRVDALDRATTPPRVVEFGLVVTDLF
ncbi:C39 family peptidase [Lysobacter sp. BMK333-48F3]|uniref:C39 family peptidase n=1 Tax=Lysobacter sp. BMK333-48F3 TaxID=2867962 RepID=UPI001C8C33B7|nr:C39 family peptidase [Lysobacter sp. BMK333-48F3]MBX9401045.1 C39 family peptidase [Lysobacter sp. BMK333-48F3]